MPIYDQGYQRWNGELRRYPMRWWPIVRQGVLQVLPQRKYLFLLVLAWLGPFLRGVLLLGLLSERLAGVTNVVRNMFSGPALDPGPSFFWAAIEGQGLFVLLFTVMVGSELISSDRRFNALQIYFSKPLTPNDYVLGKLGVVATFILLAIWAPMLLLWLFGLMVEPSFSYALRIWWVPFAITAYALLVIAVAGMLILALSAVGRRGVYIAGSWLILFGYGLAPIVALLQALSGDEYWGLVQLAGNLGQVGAWWFGVTPPNDYHPVWSLLVLALSSALCYAIVRRKIEPVEVVL